MVNKCAAPKCRTGYECVRKNQLATFSFPLKKIELNTQWVGLFSRKNWKPTKNPALCELHFQKQLPEVLYTKGCS